ncbi:glycosyl hydrolase family 18 protein [Niastella populi]|uniref:chitinase n=1 Tax=Niastella populi TaxID=550983 RepID=A0A1V9G656_9BACT|nr:glycosyl hydrolase family 18 protein [Niastella populi]OQP66129.1 glycoside hydrolase [Niastella populi]
MIRNLGKIGLFSLLFAAAAPRAEAQFRVVGYMPSWAGDVNVIQYNKLTHINYAFALPTWNGGLQPLENAWKLQSLVSQAHARNVKVCIAVGGWNNGDDGAFESLAANATYRTNFVNALIGMVNQYGLDGVDMDWEYPDNGASANNYVALMSQLSTELHNRGKILTAAVVGINGSSILSSVFNVVDFLNLMAYDYNSFDHSTFSYAQQSLNYWKGRGLPASKAVLGVPFYGRPSWETFTQLVNRGANPNADVFNGVGYNGITTIKNKTNLAWDQGGGIMIWELSGDFGAGNSNSLLSAINEVVINRGGSNPPNPGNPFTIQAENYNSMAGVQTEATTDAGGGSNVGWIDATDWMAFYNINFPVTGTYKVEYRVASLNGGGRVSCDLNAGSIQLGAVDIPSTGGWQNWTTVSHNVHINAGTYNFGVYAQSGGWNLNWIRITPPATGAKISTNGEMVSNLINNSVQSGKAFTIYPNPVQQTLNISNGGESLAGGTIRIYDIQGKQVVTARAASNQINVSALRSGVYTLEFIKGDKKITRQFIK